MLRAVKTALLITGKGAGDVDRVIRRIEIDKVTFTGICYRRSEIALREGDVIVPKILVDPAQRIRITDGGVLITAKRRIELPRGIYPVQAVIAGLIQIQRPRGALCSR